MKQGALRLVGDAEEGGPARSPLTDPNGAVERVFAHWVAVLGKDARRCVLGPSRRKAIRSALLWYDEETLQLAIEGCACSAFHRGENDRQTEYTELALIFRDEEHIERFAQGGERLRAMVEAESRRAQTQTSEAAEPAMDPARKAELQRRLRDMANRTLGRAGRGADA